MKKIILLCAMAFGLAVQAQATTPAESALGEIQGSTTATSIAIPATTVWGAQNLYLTDLVAFSNAASTLTITSLGVNLFQVVVASGVPFAKTWARGVKSATNGDLTISISGGTQSFINYSGVAR